MRVTELPGSVYRFGSFELNGHSGELRKHGLRIKIQEQPLQILLLLLEHSGGIVSREMMRDRLWPPGTHVDYDNAINSAVRKLRDALCDDSENPRFVETVARRGYRFTGHIEAPPAIEIPQLPLAGEHAPPGQPSKSKRKTSLAVVWCGAAFLLAAAVCGWVLLYAPAGVPAQLRPVPLTASPGWEGAPSFSPDGSQVAYSWSASGNILTKDHHIYVKTVGSGKPLQLTTNAKPDRNPAWSPDGRSIAFLRSLESTTGLYVIPVLGGVERKVAEGDFGTISWSPDSKFLATSEAAPVLPEHSSLRLVDLENGNKFALTTPSADKPEDRNPSFSPDGKRILFVRCDGGNRCGLYLQDLTRDFRTSGEPQLIRWVGTLINDAAWMPDAGDIVYSSSEDATITFQLMRLHLRGTSEPKFVAVPDQRPREVAVARRGNRMAYAQSSLNYDIWQIRPGKPPQSFVSSTRIEKDPQFSPDGKHVVFSSDRSGVMQIWVCDQDGANPVQLTHFDSGISGTPRWSPDGRVIAFDHESKQGWRIYLMASDGGQSRPLTPGDGKRNEVIPSWSRDGKYVYYSSDEGRNSAEYGLSKSPFQGGKSVQLTNDHGTTAFESVDGESLYYLRGYDQTSDLWRLPLRGGEANLVLKGIVNRGFVVVENGLYYLTIPNADGSGSLRFQSFTTGKQSEIAALKEVDSGGLSVSPDRKTILYSASIASGSNVMIVDNFQ